MAWERALAYLRGLLAPVERKNGWQLAEYAGDARPDGVQRLLSTYRWDEDGVRDDLREYVVEHLGDERGGAGGDGNGVLETGKVSRREWSGSTTGRRGMVERCQVGSIPGLRRAVGHPGHCLDRELYTWPRIGSGTWDRREAAGVPDELPALQETKADLAKAMIETCRWRRECALCVGRMRMRRTAAMIPR